MHTSGLWPTFCNKNSYSLSRWHIHDSLLSLYRWIIDSALEPRLCIGFQPVFFWSALSPRRQLFSDMQYVQRSSTFCGSQSAGVNPNTSARRTDINEELLNCLCSWVNWLYRVLPHSLPATLHCTTSSSNALWLIGLENTWQRTRECHRSARQHRRTTVRIDWKCTHRSGSGLRAWTIAAKGCRRFSV